MKQKNLRYPLSKETLEVCYEKKWYYEFCFANMAEERR